MQRNVSWWSPLITLWVIGLLVMATRPLDGGQSFGNSLLPSRSKHSEKEQTDSPGKCIGQSDQKNTVTLSSAALMSLVARKQPLNPPALLGRNHLNGIVKIEVLVNEKGEVQCSVGRSDHLLAKDSAVRSVSTWVFKPYVIDGKAKPVISILAVSYDFRRAT